MCVPARVLMIGLFLGSLALPGAAELESLRAERITPETAAALQIGGPDAIGGVGDWYLANDLIEVIVDDVERLHGTLNHGGTLVDAGLRDRRGEDQFARLVPLANLSQRVFLGYDAIRAEVDAERGRARLVVTGSGMSALARDGGILARLEPGVPRDEALASVHVETEYALERGDPFVRITTRFHNRGSEEAPLFAFGEFWMRGGRSLRSFVGNTLDPEFSRGFQHRSFDPTDLSTAFGAIAPLTFVAMPGVIDFPPIAYALFAPERSARGLPLFGLTSDHIDLILAFVGDPDWSEIGGFELVSGLFRGLGPGESWSYSRNLLVAGRAEVSALTDRIFRETGLTDGATSLVGRIEPPSLPVVIHVDGRGGHPVTQLRPDTSGPLAGEFRAALPPGDYRLRFRSAQRPTRILEVSVPVAGEARVPKQVYAPLGGLVFGPAFWDGGPGRVIVRGVGETPDPVFADELLDFRLNGRRTPSGRESDSLYFGGEAGDPAFVALSPGRYTLTAVRGPEFDVVVREIVLSDPGERLPVPPFQLTRVASLPGWVSADLHVHAEASDDSAVPNAARLRHFAAEGVRVLVATDHDNVPDYRQALRETGLGGEIMVVTGVEITSSAPSAEAPWSIGHHNAWPVTRQAEAHRGGAPASQKRSVADLYAGLRARGDVDFVQLNHPSGSDLDDGAYFTHLAVAGKGYDAALPISAQPNRALLTPAADGTRALDFDAMEVMNGRPRAYYLRARRDWYSLLRQGFPRTGTANSDSHGPDELAGYPRNYVWLGEDAPTPAALNRALRAGRSFGTNGPLLLDFQVNGAGMGELASAPDGQLAVRYEVVAAPWVPLDEIRMLVNGEVVHRSPTRSGTQRLRVRGDAFVTLEAGAPLDADPANWARIHPGLYTERVAPGHLPAAFSNPIYVDVDGDARFTPPGLSPRAPRWQLGHWLIVGALLAFVAALWRRSRGARDAIGSS